MLATLSMLIAFSHQTADSEILFKKSRLNCSEWAQAANYYIGLGEAQAVAELRDKSAGKSPKSNVRVGLICRIIFEPKGKGPLRQPRFGGLSLPYLTMPLSKWPEYPLARESGVWFLLDENYMLGGEAEPAREYIKYCQQEGRFRAEKVAVPTSQEAADAYSSLIGSKRWRDIRWSDSARGIDYNYDRQWTAEILKAQTRLGS